MSSPRPLSSELVQYWANFSTPSSSQLQTWRHSLVLVHHTVCRTYVSRQAVHSQISGTPLKCHQEYPFAITHSLGRQRRYVAFTPIFSHLDSRFPWNLDCSVLCSAGFRTGSRADLAAPLLLYLVLHCNPRDPRVAVPDRTATDAIVVSRSQTNRKC